MIELTIADLVERFPDFRVAVIVAESLTISSSRSEAVDKLLLAREIACRQRHRGIELSAIPGVAAWRSAYKGFGIKKTSYRSSVERLIKRVQAGERLPAINDFVDLYNAVSLEHALCVGADDLDKIAPPIAFRFSRPGDSFIDMAAESRGSEDGGDPNDPPKEGEVVLADTRHVLCRRWNWRQDMRSAITPATRRALVTIQANGWGNLEEAAADLAALLSAACSAEIRTAYADRHTPTVRLA